MAHADFDTAIVEAYDVDAQSWLPAPTGVRLRVVREVAVGPEGHAPVPLGTRGGVAHLVATGEGYIRSAQIRVEIPAIVSEPPVAEASADLESGNGLGRWVGFGVLVLLVLGFIARRRQRR